MISFITKRKWLSFPIVSWALSNILVAVFVFCAFVQAAQAETQSYEIGPQTTDPGIIAHLNNHYVSINPGVAPKNLLFLFFPGTGGLAVNTREINHTAADLGFHAMNLTYPNDDPVNMLCGGNIDLDCYADVRLETKDGTDRTPLVNVNHPNSIENRVIKLLIYLQSEYPTDNWGQFLIDDTTIDWSKIVVSGHSQGGGYAGIIGRYHPVVRVVMFAAMDFNGTVGSPANWIALPATTPNASSPDRFWGFSHQQDPLVSFNTLSTQIWPAYGMHLYGAPAIVDGATPPYGGTHSLTSNLGCGNFHGCIVVDAQLEWLDGVPVYKPVWEYLLSNLAVDAVGGSARNTNVAVAATGCGVTTGTWTVLETVSFNNPTPHYCIATGSADAFRPTTANGEHIYYFTVSNQVNPRCNQGQERTLTFWNQVGIWDNPVKKITTTGGWMAPANADPGYFTVPAGNRTIYLLARKATVATLNLTVDDASLTVTCTDSPFQTN